jgi:hypothetical protein
MLTYAHLNLVITDRDHHDRAPQMPLLGLLSGFGFALLLWSGIAWVALALVR